MNPTTSVVLHNVNGKLYDIPPGATVEVRGTDVEDLLKILGFLIVVDGETAMEAVMNETGDIEMKETTVAEVVERRKKEKPELSCDGTVVVISNRGVRNRVPCGFKTVSKRALLAHAKNEHPKGERSIDSPAADETTRDDIREEATESRKPGRPRKNPVEGF